MVAFFILLQPISFEYIYICCCTCDHLRNVTKNDYKYHLPHGECHVMTKVTTPDDTLMINGTTKIQP